MGIKKILVAASSLFLAAAAYAQTLKPGFDKSEYLECLGMAAHMDSLRVDHKYLCPPPTHFRKVYVSPRVGFDNAWELWQSDSGVMAIMLRATVSTTTSWGANFNAAMVRAVGTCHVGRDVDYDLCPDPAACVHAGWVAGLMTMADDILAKVDSCHKAGRRDFIIAGHSQGGALAYLATAMLRRGQAKGAVPQDIRFKTYASAAPKPGDYIFALNYEAMTQPGWSITVVNSEDWVPETPLSIQRTSDFRPTNPFAQMDRLTAGVKMSKKMKIKFLFSKLSRPAEKEVANWTKYLGGALGGMLQDAHPWFRQPDYVECVNYARAGQFYVLKPDADYFSRHPQVSEDAFDHHQYVAYYELAKKIAD